MIITDLDELRKPSEPVNDLEVREITEKLSSTIPANGLGLAAPQIGIHKRMFMANLSVGSFIVVNPKITNKSVDQVPSTEACLSIPDTTRCIKRHQRITAECEKLIDLNTNTVTVDAELSLKHMDAFIFQHENDHLDGVLILDHEETLSKEQLMLQKNQKRANKILMRRNRKKLGDPPVEEKPKKLSAKKEAKLKKAAKKKKRERQRQARREKMRVEIEERYKASQKGLFDQQENSASEESNSTEQPAAKSN